MNYKENIHSILGREIAMAELIKLETGAYDTGAKRIYAPYELKVKCPKCQHVTTVNYEQVPVATEQPAGVPFDVYEYCEECDKEIVLKMRFDITISLVDEKADE
ncbi:hypothetical protein BCJMU07_p320 (plasmid) [Bacillus cereus]|nr:hypothetical protein BCJMU07_p320 [Bacillus cereus]BCD32884.1 hypothetical protein BC30102_p313 [Bacillus cereus]